MSKKRNFNQTSEIKSDMTVDDVNEVKEDNTVNEVENEGNQEVKDEESVETVPEEDEGIVEEISEPITLDEPDIDFTIEKGDKPQEEKDLDAVITDIKNIIETATDDMAKIIDESEKKVEEVENKKKAEAEANKYKGITFEKMFGYFWNGQNYNL